MCSRHQWHACVIDVKTAFLNADLEQVEGENIILIMPPGIFKEKKVVLKTALYSPSKAIYGLRRSPRLWGGCRDSAMSKFEIWIKEGKRKIRLKLVQMNAEPNLWKVTEEEDEDSDPPTLENGKIRGFVMTYVDDIFIAAPQHIKEKIAAKFQETWSTSNPQDVTSDPVRFLGMDVKKERSGDGRDVWLITQEAYIQDVANKMDPTPKEKRIPITKDQAMMIEDVKTPNIEGVRLCQKAVGEVLWLVSRSRPDVMFAASRMGSCVTKSTEAVMETANQLWGYLVRTKDEGLKFEDHEEKPVELQVFSDASFAPDALESQGAFIVLVNSSPLFWRAGKQSNITLSTAESELNELVEAMNAGESVGAIIEEVYPSVLKQAYTDSSSALAIMVNEGGSWRTRHLRLRASYARQAVSQGLWQLTHVPGEEMVADIGTKALSMPRFEKLKPLMGMRKVEKSKEGEDQDEEKKEKKGSMMTTPSIDTAVQAVRLITLAAVLQLAEATEEIQEDEEPEGEFPMFVIMYTILVACVTILMQWEWRVGARRWNGPRLMNQEEESGEEEEREDDPSENQDEAEDVRRGREEDRNMSTGSEEPPEEEVEKDQPQRVVPPGGRGHPGPPPPPPPRYPGKGPGALQAQPKRGGKNQKGEARGQEAQRQEPPPQPARQGDRATRKFLKTKTGSVYHVDWECGYLTAPKTGMARRLMICQWCDQHVTDHGLQPIYSGTYHDEIHLTPDCPHKRGERKTLCCTQCRARRPRVV